MIRSGLNPGNVNVRLGAVMSLMDDTVRNADLATHANLLERMATLLSVYMTEKQLKEYEGLPGMRYGDEAQPSDVFRDLNAKERFLLRIASDNGVYARKQVEMGDASSLDEEVETEGA